MGSFGLLHRRRPGYDDFAASVRTQLVDDLTRRTDALAPYVSATIDHSEVDRLIGTLLTDKRTGTRAALEIIELLWPDEDPEVIGSSSWWRTPLGLAVADRMSDDSTIISNQEARLILDVKSGTVSQLRSRGALEAAPHSRANVTRGSVLRRVVSQYLAKFGS